MKGIRETELGPYDGMPMLNSRSSEKIVLSEEPCGILIQNSYVKKGDPWKYYISLKEGLAAKFDTAGTLGILENDMGISLESRRHAPGLRCQL